MGGIELALACDVIVASTAATLAYCHPGAVGGGGGSETLREAIGRATCWLLWTGDLLTARAGARHRARAGRAPRRGFQDPGWRWPTGSWPASRRSAAHG